jgi:lipopolysaccharide export LptBFGC system permease protein LptF
MPLTLYAYILKDLVKLLAMSTFVLVLVMSVGFMIKPISEGSLDALSMLKLLLYVMPGMLTYAMPIGAAFAATLVFFRLAADNEVTACAMSGISYRSMLMPTVMLGLILTGGMFFLSNYVIPIFWTKVAQVAQQDIARWFVEQIDGRQVVKVERQFIIYADDAWLEDLPPAPNDGQNWPYQRVALKHAAVGKIDSDTGRLEADFTGELAVADLYRGPNNQTVASVKLTNASLKHPDTGFLVVVQEHAFPPKIIPSPIRVRPEMLSLEALNEMSEHPEQHPKIETLVETLRTRMSEQIVLGQIEQALTESATKTLNLTGPQSDEYTIESPIVVRDGKSLDLTATEDRPVVVRIGRGAVLTQRLEARTGRIDIVAGEEPRIAIKLSNVTVLDPRLPADLPEPTQVKVVYLTLLRMPAVVTGALPEGALPLIEMAEQRKERTVLRAAARMANEINELRDQISTAVHERGAMAVCALLVMLLGGAMAMLLRNQVPLVIFFWCFLPAIVAIFMVSGGKNLIRADGIGLGDWFNAVMIWSGNVMLLVVVGLIYRKLARH